MSDADLQYRFAVGSRHDIVTGAGYRANTFHHQAKNGTGFNVQGPALLASTFIQDEIRLSDSLALTVGSKFERNSFTGFEYEPGAQLVWSPDDRKALWFSAARSIRQPAWSDESMYGDFFALPLDGGLLGVGRMTPNPNVQAEQLWNFEGGYRTEISKRVSVDATGFVNHYGRLVSFEPLAPFFEFSPAPPHLVLPFTGGNLLRGDSYGGELYANWQINGRWRISTGYSFLQWSLATEPGSQDLFSVLQSGDAPKHQVQVRSMVNLPRNLEWDTSAYYVGALRNGPVASYARVDTRLGWHLGESWELSVAGQNLLSPRRVEMFDPFQTYSTQVQRSIVGKITWRF
jgi:iron complex outermembrane receptor protein